MGLERRGVLAGEMTRSGMDRGVVGGRVGASAPGSFCLSILFSKTPTWQEVVETWCNPTGRFPRCLGLWAKAVGLGPGLRAVELGPGLSSFSGKPHQGKAPLLR